MAEISSTAVQSIEWREDHLRIIDQTYLPKREVYNDIRDIGRAWEAIKKLRVRGAPAIGIAAGYGFYLGIKDLPENTFQSFWIEIDRIASYLESARPTAVNLKWAINRIKSTIQANKEKSIDEIKEIVLQTAKTIHAEDKRTCKKIGENGQPLIPSNANILTHCNTGSLATGQYGTALSVIFHAQETGKKPHVWVGETRPLFQGARLTTWELMNADVSIKLITDSMAGMLMNQKKVDLIIVGADHVSANGDTANKIGTYSLAVLAHYHHIPFYVAIPTATIDMHIDSGDQIPIEERDPEEITSYNGSMIAPKKTEAYNPAFDVTPAELITAFITEKGIVEPPYKDRFRQLFSEKN